MSSRTGDVGAAEALREATARLTAAGVEGAARDARLLLAEALGCRSDRLVLHMSQDLPAEAEALLDALVADRCRFRPMSQILGRRVFWGRDFAVTADVLDPRPETETLIAAALAGPPPARILDLGTGSGAILVTLLAEWPGARGLGTDTSAAALAVAGRNAARHGVASRASFRRADWTAGIAERFDLVVCNPPYIPSGELARLAPEVREWEPHAALTAGRTGLEAYVALAPKLARVIAEGARVLLEHGAGQAGDLAELFAAAGFRAVAHHDDLDGRSRVIELHT